MRMRMGACSLCVQKHEESWWLVLGDAKSNALLAIKRLALQQKCTRAKLEFTLPSSTSSSASTASASELLLYLMSDSYLGCDQEYKLTIPVSTSAPTPTPAPPAGPSLPHK